MIVLTLPPVLGVLMVRRSSSVIPARSPALASGRPGIHFYPLTGPMIIVSETIGALLMPFFDIRS